MNENEYLEMVNDLRDQYQKMKEKYTREIALKDEELNHLWIKSGIKPQLVYTTDIFTSDRPMAAEAVYTDSVPTYGYYSCTRCGLHHPNRSICHLSY